MNILLINHYAGSREYGMEYRPYYLAREWQRRGHRVRIVAASCSHLRIKPPKLTGTITEENIDGISYVWLKTPGYRGNGARRAINMFAFVGQLFRHARWLIKNQKPDVIIASSTYPLDTLPARFMARRCGARLVYEVHDLWPLSPIELGNMSPRHPFIRLMQWAEDYACRSVDRVVSMLPNAQIHLQEHGMDAAKFAYVPNGIAIDEWERGASPLPETHSATLRTLHESGQFVLGYAGGHAVSNALEFLMQAARLVADQRVTLVLVGDGAEKTNLVGQAKALNLRNVIFLPAVSKNVVPALLREMDALYIGWQNKPIYRFGVSPNKVFDYMMASKPVIHSVNASNDVVAESGCGITVPPENPEAIAEAIRQLAFMSENQREELGQRGRNHVLKHHDYRVLAQRFLEGLI